MNTKDFVVLPWGKPGHSVKLKYKQAQELRMEKVQLELENQEMEKKLQEFQSTWKKEKEKIKSNGYHWKSGNVCKLGNQSHIMSQNKGNAIKLSSGKVKLKLLKQQIQEPIQQAVNHTMADSRENEKPKIKGKVCGQCEKNAAFLVCLECGEDYCSRCFAKIHQKGALRLHRTTLLQAKSQTISSVLDVAHQFIKEVNPDECKGGNNSTKESNKSQHKPKSVLLQGSNSEVEITTKIGECSNPRVGRLCEGMFDEAASARSFQEALTQWRAETQEDSKEQNFHSAKADTLEECEVQTNLKIWAEPIKIEFTEDSLSYMEKLWLKKHRRTLQEQPDISLYPPAATASTADVQASQDGSGDDSDIEEIKVKYPPLFMPVEELNIERPEPSLTIMELDDTYEEECEETGNIVPYKVELADSESQLSNAFPAYQKNCFLCESDICQHRVFNKGRLDLSYLYLRSSPTYYNDDLKAETSNTDCDNIVDFNTDSPDTEKIGENSSSEGHLKEKNINTESIKNTDDSCMSLGSKDFLPTTNLDTIFIKEIFSKKKSFDFTNLPEKPCPKDPKTIQSSLLLQEIVLRNKPANEQYQGLERFFTFNQNEKLNLVPSQSLESSCSNSRMPLAGDSECIPDHSVGGHVDDTDAFDVLKSMENPSPRVRQQKKGQKSQRPSTANLPLSSSVKKHSSCLPSPHGRSRSVAAQSLSRAASEISEIEYIDNTDQHEPSLDHTADQQTLDSLEKELKVLINLTDSSEKLSSLSTEELPAFKHNWLNMSQISSDFPITSDVRGPCGAEELSSSGKDTGMHSVLSLSDYSTDEDEENFLDKQQVMILPWSKSS